MPIVVHPDEAIVLWDLEDYARKQAKYEKKSKRGRWWWEPHTCSAKTAALKVTLGELIHYKIYTYSQHACA